MGNFGQCKMGLWFQLVELSGSQHQESGPLFVCFVHCMLTSKLPATSCLSERLCPDTDAAFLMLLPEGLIQKQDPKDALLCRAW